METRIYVVRNSSGAARVVQAPNPAQALRHVTKQEFTVRAATAVEVANLMSAGAKLELAGAEPDFGAAEAPADNAPMLHAA